MHAQHALISYNQTKNTRKYIKDSLRRVYIPQLSQRQIKAAKDYYMARGYNLNNTYWHRYYTGVTGEFHEDYVPLDIFRSMISFKLNQRKQWPALLDKNLSYNLFKEFKQPKRIVQNVNGFYFVNNKIVSQAVAEDACNINNKTLVIKPTLESGKGKMVEIFMVENNQTSVKNYSVTELFKRYKKDFIVQEAVEQNEALNALNPSSLNTLRMVSYLRDDGVHILSSAVRIGEPGSKTDNFSGGGMFCGIKKNGQLKEKGHTKSGEIKDTTLNGAILKDIKIPNYDKVKTMVEAMHLKIPYFRIVSWDIGIDKLNEPVFIEYNSCYQGIEIQIPNGPLFGKFADEILALGREPY